MVEGLWARLDQTTNACPGTYDYHPGGGMRIFACHLFSVVSPGALMRVAGVPAFLSGPHGPDALDLGNPAEFGHYNPEFVRWLARNGVPTAPAHKVAFQPAYDRYVAPLARVHHVVKAKLDRDATCREREVQAYQEVLADGGDEFYYERWYEFLDDGFCDGRVLGGGEDWDGNVVKSVTGFWLRRTIDGTAGEFDAALLHLLAEYDAEWLRTH